MKSISKSGSEHKKLIEAALFMASEPISIKELGRVVGIGSLGHLEKLVLELQAEYANRGIQIIKSSAGWVMQPASELLSSVAHLTPYSDLSEGCKRTLAIIVYKEPLSQAELVKTQGNKAYSYVKKLTKLGLVKAAKAGRTKILSLTSEFENYFGQSKERIKEQLETEYAKTKKA